MLVIRHTPGPRAEGKRPDLHGLASQLVEELDERTRVVLEELLASHCRAVAKDFVEERGFPRSIVSCIFVSC